MARTKKDNREQGPEVRHAGRVTKSAVGLVSFALAGGSLLFAAPAAFAASSAPTHGKTTCQVAGDECTNAVNYANAHDGGGAKVLAVEADTEAHGGAVKRRVFDIRMQTNNGVFVEHVLRSDSTSHDAVWWESRAENQNPNPNPNPNPSGNSPDRHDHSPDHHKPGSGSVADSAKISAGQAATDATNFVTGRGYQVLGVKHDQLKSSGQKDYYQVKLQLGNNGRKHGTTNVWVDATSSPGTVTAASGSGLSYRDASIVSPATAKANAVAATGGGSAYKWNINGGKWRWYWVFVRNGSTKYKVGVDAVTGVVTQVKQN